MFACADRVEGLQYAAFTHSRVPAYGRARQPGLATRPDCCSRPDERSRSCVASPPSLLEHVSAGGIRTSFHPRLPMINPFSFVRSLSRRFSPAAGTLVFLSSANSTPCMSPAPRTSPMMGYFSCSSPRRSLLLQDLLSQAQCFDLFHGVL